MKSIIKNKHIGLLAISFIIIGCGGPPQNNPLLIQAQTEYKNAESNSIVFSKAPVALKEAKEALEKSEHIWSKKGDKEMIEHYAYISQQKTKIAEETAKLNDAQDEVGRAEAERNQVLIEARKAKAISSEQKAQVALGQVKSERAKSEQALAELKLERAAAERAREENRQLTERLSELKARESDRGIVLTLGDVLFDFDNSKLKPGASKAVKEMASFLKKYPKRTIQIEGFTDGVGAADYNQDLSKRRADALKTALTNAGVSDSRIKTIGYGQEFPIASNDTEAGKQQNRRVEIIISKNDGVIKERTN